MSYPSRYGAEDILGAMNLITPETVLGAVALIKKGIIYDLSHNLDQEMPIPGFHWSVPPQHQFHPRERR